MISFYQLPEDIRDEFAVTSDGRVRAKSWAGVARLAGVSSQTIYQRILPRLLSIQPEALPITLQPLSGKDLKHTTEIDEMAISCVVNYYAWESEQGRNDTAKEVAMVFNAIGVRAFFQKELGWESRLATQTDSDSRLDKINETLESVIARLGFMEAKLDGRIAAESKYPGIVQIVNNITINNILPSADLKEPYTAREYVELMHGKELTRGECHSLGRHAANSFTTLSLDSPEKYGTKALYYYKDLPAWDAVYRSWVNAR